MAKRPEDDDVDDAQVWADHAADIAARRKAGDPTVWDDLDYLNMQAQERSTKPE